MSEITPGGSEIFHHTEPTGPSEVPEFDESLRTALEEHLAQFLPEEPRILHEIISEGLHLDVYVWEPTEDRPWWTLVTMGMSERAMNVPEGLEHWARSELVLTLPAEWPMPADPDEFQQVFADEELFWPIRALKSTARLPATYDTFLTYGHTVAAGEEPGDTFPGSPYAAVMLAGAASLPPDAMVAEVGDTPVFFWGLYPIYPIEQDFKLQEGADPLFEMFLNAGYHEGVFPNRPPLVEAG